MLKRIFDIVIASILFILLFPFVPFVLLAFWILGRQPIILKAPRIGENEKQFNYYIFNTQFKQMYPKEEFESNGHLNGGYSDRVIRSLKLYLWPALINIIKGDMSFIGPIPESQEISEKYNEKQRKIFSVRPGLLSSGFFCDARSIDRKSVV